MVWASAVMKALMRVVSLQRASSRMSIIKPDVLGAGCGNAGTGAFERELALIDPALLRTHGGLQALFDRAHGFEVLVQPDAVGRTAVLAQVLGLVANEVEHAGVVALKRGDERGVVGIQTRRDGRFAGAEEAVEGELRNDLFGDRGMRVAPGDEGSVHAGKAAAGGIDAGAGGFEAEFEARQHGAIADALGGELIDGGAAGVEIVAGGAFDIAAGEPGGHFGPVAIAADGLGIPEIFEEEEIALQIFEGFEMGRELVVLAVAFGRPVLGTHSVGHVHEDHAQGRFGEGIGGSGGRHSLEPGKGECGSGAAKYGSS